MIRKTRRLAVFITLIVFGLGFVTGVVVHRSGQLGLIKREIYSVLQISDHKYDEEHDEEYDEANPENELLRFAFVDELVQDEDQLYPPSRSFDQISQRINDYLVDASLFPDAYANVEVLDASLDGHVFKLNYSLQEGNPCTAYSYFLPEEGEEVSCAILIIPGSGLNQSSHIFRRDVDNYHKDIVNVTEKYCDTFIFVKPNEDFTAIHNGEKKLSYNFIINYLINHGGSYSARYLMDSLAITKYLKRQYEQVVVMGLSQGGAAALLNSLQSEPTAAVIASGFSVISTETILWSGFNQIVIPGVDTVFIIDKIFDIIESSDTFYLFTFGKEEVGTYKIEAEEGYTCEFFKDLDNVTCLSCADGHVFPQAIIEDLLSSHEIGVR